MTTAAVVTAAGYGTRLGAAEPKALVQIGERTLLEWALTHLAPLVDHVVVTAPPTHVPQIEAVCDVVADLFPDLHTTVVAGGDTRQASVAVAVSALFDSDRPTPSRVMVHDAARAFMPTAAMRAVVEAVSGDVDGAVPVVPVVDTIVAAPDADGHLGEPVDRATLRAVQTPQVFTAAALRDAHTQASGDATATDDAMVVMRAGYRVVVVDGHAWGFKVTSADDVAWAEHIARQLSEVTPS